MKVGPDARRVQRQRGVTLVELLVVLIVMSVISTMIVGTWFALAQGYSRESQSSEQRDFAQQAVERLTRELRDAQAAPSALTSPAAIVGTDLGPYEISFNTSFNTTTASNPTSVPRLVRYVLTDGTLYRDLAGPDRTFGTADDSRGILVEHVVNEGQGVDLFQYYYYDGTGRMVHSTGTSQVPSSLTNRIKAIKVTLLVDLQPGRSPEYMKIVNMVQLRNQRSF